MIKLILFLLISQVYAQGRLDPHGIMNTDLYKAKSSTHSECLTCHTNHQNKWHLKKDASNRCLDCHNPNMHSGMIEHMGKIQKADMPNPGKLINCLSCHRPHRSPVKDDKMTWQTDPSFIFHRRKDLNQNFKVKHSRTPMLKTNCVSCHSWKSLK